MSNEPSTTTASSKSAADARWKSKRKHKYPLPTSTCQVRKALELDEVELLVARLRNLEEQRSTTRRMPFVCESKVITLGYRILWGALLMAMKPNELPKSSARWNVIPVLAYTVPPTVETSMRNEVLVFVDAAALLKLAVALVVVSRKPTQGGSDTANRSSFAQNLWEFASLCQQTPPLDAKQNLSVVQSKLTDCLKLFLRRNGFAQLVPEDQVYVCFSSSLSQNGSHLNQC